MEKSNGKFSIGPTVTTTQPKTLAIAKVPVNIKSPVAHKTGTLRTVDGVTAATNDVGLVTLLNGRHLAIIRFCFRFWSKRCGTRGSHRKSGFGSMGRMEQIVAEDEGVNRRSLW